MYSKLIVCPSIYNSELLQQLFITSYIYFNHMRSRLGGYFKTIPYNELLSDIAFDLQAPY